MAPDDPGEVRRDWEAREHPQPENAIFALFSASTAASAGAARVDWRDTAAQRWSVLSARVGREWTLRSLLEHLTGEDVLERVRTVLQRHLAAHLDLGLAAWRNPQRERGFWAAWRACAGLDMVWELDDLPNVRDEITWLPDDPVDVLGDELPRVIADEALRPGYLERLALRHRRHRAVGDAGGTDFRPAVRMARSVASGFKVVAISMSATGAPIRALRTQPPTSNSGFSLRIRSPSA